MPTLYRNIALVTALIIIGGSISYLEGTKVPRVTQGGGEVVTVTPLTTTQTSEKGDRSDILKQKSATYPLAKELADIQGYINTKEFKLSDYVGKKVILVDFWTYSCINCQRTTPYLNEWYVKYKDKGLVIVGVHTPEFDFEKKYDNVVNAVQSAGIQYPVVLDSNFGTWNAYNNHYWPHEFFIDIDGYIVHDHIGEGGYDQTESVIQKLLAERALVLGENVDVAMPITVKHQDDIATESPETYFGAARNEYLGNGKKNVEGNQYFEEPQTVLPNTLYLIGQWYITPEFAETSPSVGTPTTGSDRVLYKYKSKRLYFVAGTNGTAITVEVTRDSAPIEKSVRGADVFEKNGRTYVTISKNRLYKIVEDSVVDNHLIEFIISKPGLQAFTFTFG